MKHRFDRSSPLSLIIDWMESRAQRKYHYYSYFIEIRQLKRFKSTFAFIGRNKILFCTFFKRDMHARYVTYSKTCYPAVFRVIASTEYFTSYLRDLPYRQACSTCNETKYFLNTHKRKPLCGNPDALYPFAFHFFFLFFTFLLKFNFLVNNRNLKILFRSTSRTTIVQYQVERTFLLTSCNVQKKDTQLHKNSFKYLFPFPKRKIFTTLPKIIISNFFLLNHEEGITVNHRYSIPFSIVAIEEPKNCKRRGVEKWTSNA